MELHKIYLVFSGKQWINLILMIPIESETFYDFIKIFTNLNKTFLFMSLTYKFE